jgi:cation diffusion facilitator family transporter
MSGGADHHEHRGDHLHGDDGDHGHHHHDEVGGRGARRWGDLLKHLIHGHSHDAQDSFDSELMVSKAGTRALAISFAGLLVTAVAQLIVFMASRSVGLLADTIHNFADALTAVPIGLAFLVARRQPTDRYTYGYGRAEDLAGVTVVAVMAVSAGLAAWEAIDRLIHPRDISHLGWVAVAGGIGFLGNELAARYRIRVGTRIGSAALVADGRHARTDGFTSLAVVLGAIGVALGWPRADPVVGLAITITILAVVRQAARDVLVRLLDGVDPRLVTDVERRAAAVAEVQAVDNVRLRWIGHQLQAELDITVDHDLSISHAHGIAEAVRHDLLHHIPRLTNAVIHTNPSAHDGPDPHELTAHHDRSPGGRDARRPARLPGRRRHR